MNPRLAKAFERVFVRRGRVWAPLTLMVVIISFFTITYRLMGVERHFEITEEQKGRPWFSSLYVSCMAFSNAMGDSAPRTMPGRWVFLAQVMIGFLTLLLGGILF